MNARSKLAAIILVITPLILAYGCGKLYVSQPTVIFSPESATVQERLAAREVQRYVYLRSGQLLNIVRGEESLPAKDNVIIVARKDRTILESFKNNLLISSLKTIGKKQYLLKSVQEGNRNIIVISGGDEIGTLYSAYRFAEHLGVRFYLHGDVIPDERTAFSTPTELDEVGVPLFDIRGILPFHDFPEGPDWWNVDDYKAILSQLSKLRMNFIGLHTYPEIEVGRQVGPEPTVWIGMSEDVNDDGTVKSSYPSRYFTTLEGEKGWGYTSKKTSEFVFGAHNLFERDAYGSDIMKGYSPWPKTPEGSNEIFNRTGVLLNEAFNYAHLLGIKTCVGTETPLTIPTLLKERLKTKGKSLDDPSLVRELYKGLFTRIAKAYDIDYYWFWTPENWIWGGNTEDEITATKDDLLEAVNAVEDVKAPFTLATCGWVLGPQSDRALFDSVLPKNMPLSCINRFLGMSPVDFAFNTISNRPKWAIPWMEDDPALSSPQLWAGRMRADAVDAFQYGCTGLIGIHWRTLILGPTVSALAKAAWDQSNFRKKPPTAGPSGENVEEFTDQYNVIGKPIVGTEDDTLYQTVRAEVSAYRLKVPDGTYTVTLKFCETLHETKGLRVFSVKIQEKMVLEDLDIFAAVGKNTALNYSFKNVNVTDGWLFIEFIRKYDFPTIAALSVQGDDYSMKINCGGTEYKDYAADWESAQPRDRDTGDFYDDWVNSQFGSEAGEEISRLFQTIDGQLPRPFNWTDNGPGGLTPDPRKWEEVSKEYEFVSDFEKLRPLIKGAGNVERFDYWLNNFKYMKTAAQLNCTRARFNEALEKVEGDNDPNAGKILAKETALPLYKDMVNLTGKAYRFLLSTVSTYGEMGTVANWDLHILPSLLGKTGEKLAEALGEDLPADAAPTKYYDGEARIIVPTVRSNAQDGEVLTLKVIVLDNHFPSRVELYWRPIGKGKFTRKTLQHVNRGVYSVQFPQEGIKGKTIEYYIYVVTNDNTEMYFPATAPEINQTVVAISQ